MNARQKLTRQIRAAVDSVRPENVYNRDCVTQAQHTLLKIIESGYADSLSNRCRTAVSQARWDFREFLEQRRVRLAGLRHKMAGSYSYRPHERTARNEEEFANAIASVGGTFRQAVTHRIHVLGRTQRMESDSVY